MELNSSSESKAKAPSKFLGCLFVSLGGLFTALFGFLSWASLTGWFKLQAFSLSPVFVIFTLMDLYLCCRGFRRFSSKPLKKSAFDITT